MTTQSVALIQSALFGDNIGNMFNDIESVIGGSNVTINTGKPLKEITVMYGSGTTGAISGLKVKYNKGNGTTTVSHGTSSDNTEVGQTKITLTDTENIIAISGRSGQTSKWGARVVQLNFSIYDSSTGNMRIAGPFGGTSEGQAFRITANGVFVGFGGYAVNTDDSITDATGKKELGGIYGLTFIEVGYRTV